MRKVCASLHNEGYEIHLIGRFLSNSEPLEREYHTHRMKMIFTKGAIFYASYNFRLFWYLLFKKIDIVHSNDLDTLLANYLISRIKRIPLIYDSHEYFTGVPEIQNRRFVKAIWSKLENWIFPKLNHIFTVNDSIAALYKKQFHKEIKVIRNIPTSQKLLKPITRQELKISDTTKILVLQGAGINVDRGAEELLEAMTHLPNYTLLIIGSGDVIETLKKRAAADDLKEKVKFFGKLPYEKMMQITQTANAGLTLDKATNINYEFSLPNKVFDYIRAQIPVISSQLIEIEKIIKKYEIGAIIPTHNPLDIAETIDEYLKTVNQTVLKSNLLNASKQLSWENEVISMIDTYKNLQ